jgi:hypothetical protein
VGCGWLRELKPTVDKVNEKLFGYLKAYNFIRLYQALNLKTPTEEFKRAILEVVRVFTMY